MFPIGGVRNILTEKDTSSHMLKIITFVFALCTDTFVASLAYGANQVEVSWQKALALNGICSGFLGLALGFGSLIQYLVPRELARAVGFVCLLLLGAVKLLDYSIKKYINTHCSLNKNFRFSLSGLKIIINIYGDPMAADWDNSRSLSWKETLCLGAAMSIDSLVAGTMAAFVDIPPLKTVAACFLMGTALMYAGLFAGRRLIARDGLDLSWLSGLLFIFLAFSRTRA